MADRVEGKKLTERTAQNREPRSFRAGEPPSCYLLSHPQGDSRGTYTHTYMYTQFYIYIYISIYICGYRLLARRVNSELCGTQAEERVCSYLFYTHFSFPMSLLSGPIASFCTYLICTI